MIHKKDKSMVLVLAFQIFVGFIPTTINATEDSSQILKRVHRDAELQSLFNPLSLEGRGPG
jgi:hypothetical protein